jgi:PAS domain S-box-containing protein
MLKISPQAVVQTIRTIERRGAAALALMVAVLVAAFLSVHALVSEAREGARVVDIASDLRLLAAQMQSDLYRTAAMGGGLDESARRQMRDNLRHMGELIWGVEDDWYLPSDLSTYYSAAWRDQTSVLGRFILAAEAAGQGRAGADSVHEIDKLGLDAFFEEGQRQLQEDLRRKVGALWTINLVAGGSVIFLFHLLYFTAFRPGLRVMRKQAEAQRFMAEAIANSGSSVLVTDPHGIVTYANDQTQTDTGYAFSDLVGQHVRMLDAGAEREDNLWRSLGEERNWSGERLMRHRDGHPYWVEAIFSPIRDEQGRLAGYLSIQHDISERKDMETALTRTREALETAIEAIDDGFALFGPDGRLAMCNSRYRTYFPSLASLIAPGISFEAVAGAIWDGRLIETDIERGDFIHRRLEAFRQAEGILEQRTADGRWYRLSERRTAEDGRVIVTTDITPLKATEARLRAAVAQAETANNAKSEFLSGLSHEMRTPLNAVMGYAQLLYANRPHPLTDRQRVYVHHILDGGGMLVQLLDEVLDLARIEAGRLSLSIEPVILSAMMGQVLPLIAGLAERRGVRLSDRIGGEGAVASAPLLAVMADAGRLRQIVLNLATNAIKYNRPEGEVVFRAERGQGDRVRLSVADTGFGIPENRQIELFQPFSRLGAEATTIEGTGIGLTVAKRLAEAMAGSIGFSSVVGAGSVFWVELPGAVPVSMARAVLAPAEVAMTGELGRADGPGTVPDRGRLESSVPMELQRRALPPRTVLYVEDNISNLELMTELIDQVSRAPCRVKTATTAEIGIDLALTERPDLIIMDVNLPGIDGITALRMLRSHAALSDIPAVALSGDAMPATRARALEAGFQRFLNKPLGLDDLRAVVNAYCDPAGAEEEAEGKGVVPAR